MWFVNETYACPAFQVGWGWLHGALGAVVRPPSSTRWDVGPRWWYSWRLRAPSSHLDATWSSTLTM